MAQVVRPSPDLMNSTTNGTSYSYFALQFDRVDPPEPFTISRRMPYAKTIKVIEDMLAGKNVV